MRSFIIARSDLDSLIDHARRDYPHEACGLIGGNDNVARQVMPIPNVAARPDVQYEMDRQSMVEAILHFERAGQEVVGIYHSHPMTDATPSPVDIAQATWPDAIYLIISLKDPDHPVVHAWIIRQGKVDLVDLIIK